MPEEPNAQTPDEEQQIPVPEEHRSSGATNRQDDARLIRNYVNHFTTLRRVLPEQQPRNPDQEEFDVQLADFKWRLVARKLYGFLLILLLFAQNIAVGYLVWSAYLSNELQNLATVLGFIVNGTLIETAFIIRIIVKWLFSDIPYRNSR